MATIKKQYFGIKFPFTAKNATGFFVDLNSDLNNKVASEIAHVILTPKKTRIRKPDFGTDLIKFIYEPSDEITWDAVEREVKESIAKYVANVELTSIDVTRPEGEDNGIYIDIQYAVKKGNVVENNRMAIKL